MQNIRRAAVCLLLLIMLVMLASCGGPNAQKPEEEEKPDPVSDHAADGEPDKLPVKVTAPTEPDEPDNSDSDENPPEEENPEDNPEEGDPAEPPQKPAANSDAKSGYSEENLDILAAETLDSITTSDMTKLQKARAIFDYVKGGIRYTGSSDKSSWKQGAYTGMTAFAGDCFTYYAVSRALLTAAGIDNLEVQRVGGPTSHYWNLVDCGDGWYHFDATPRSSKMPYFVSFMFTDQEAADYTKKAGRNYYTFDGSLYPARAGGSDTSSDSGSGSAPAAPAEASAPEPLADVPEEPVNAPPEETAPAVETPPEETPETDVSGETVGAPPDETVQTAETVPETAPEEEPEPVLPDEFFSPDSSKMAAPDSADITQ